MPVFAPASRTVGFFVGNVLKTVGFGGGLPTEIGHVGGNARGATWREDGTIVIGNSSDIVDDLIEDSSFGLQIISGDSREVRDFLPGDEKTTYRYPQLLPVATGSHSRSRTSRAAREVATPLPCTRSRPPRSRHPAQA